MRSRYFIVSVVAIVALGCRTQKSIDNAYTNGTTIGLSENNRKSISVIDSLVRGLVSDKKTVGIVYAIKIGESPMVSSQYGLADIERNVKVKATNQFRIASIQNQ